MSVTLVEGSIKSLLLDEDLRVSAVRFHEIFVPVVGEEPHQRFRLLDRVVRLRQVDDEVPLPVGHGQKVGHAADQHPEQRCAAPDGRKPVFGDPDEVRILLRQGLHLAEHVVLSGVDVDVEIVPAVEQLLDEPLELPNRAPVDGQEVHDPDSILGLRVEGIGLIVRKLWLS